MITVTAEISREEKFQIAFAKKWFMRLADDIAYNMVQQARINIRVMGAQGGIWPQLSGFGQARKHRTGTQAHSGYAKRKADGKTPGRGKYGPQQKLLDTGSMSDNLQGVIFLVPGGFNITLISAGAENQRKLEIHAGGKGHNPVRNPVSDMKFFEQKTQQMLDAFAQWLASY